MAMHGKEHRYFKLKLEKSLKKPQQTATPEERKHLISRAVKLYSLSCSGSSKKNVQNMQKQKEARPIQRVRKQLQKCTEEAQALGTLAKDFTSHKHAQRPKSQAWQLRPGTQSLKEWEKECVGFTQAGWSVSLAKRAGAKFSERPCHKVEMMSSRGRHLM